MKKGCHNLEKNCEKEGVLVGPQDRLPLQHETCDKSPGLPHHLSLECRSTFAQWQKIFATLPYESGEYPDDLPISFVSVEREIAKCISESLADVPEQKRDIEKIQALLRAYRVVVFLPGKNPNASLQRLHLILQDNYKGSCLCRLLNLFLGCSEKINTKVVTFF